MPGVEREPQLVLGLVVPVHEDALGLDARPQRQVELAAGGDVDRQPLLVHQPVDGGDGQRLRPVDHLEVVGARRERLHVGARAGAHVVLRVDVRRRAEALGQLDHVAAAHLEVARVR